MQNRTKVTAVVAVLVIGLCAALPFRRADDLEGEAKAPAASELTLRHEISRVPLTVPTSSDSRGESILEPREVLPPQPRMLTTTPYIKADAYRDRVGSLPGASLDNSSVLESETTAREEYTSREPPWERFSSPKEPYPSPLPSEPKKPSGALQRRHTIVDGDTLPDLAQRYLGNIERFREIYELNRNVLPGPELLIIGREIVIPAAN